jgi:hypothetical protein
LHGGDIAAAAQRVIGRDRPHEFALEILRVVIPEDHRPIGQQGARMDEPLFEGEAIDKRLQRRTG